MTRENTNKKNPLIIPRPQEPITLATDRDPWERQPKETQGAYYGFTLYRDMPPHERSQTKTAAQLNRNVSLVRRHAWRYRWTERIEAYDVAMEQVRRQAARQAIVEMADRHARIAMVALNKIAQRLVGDDTDPLNPVRALDPNTLSAADIARLGEFSYKLERLARGADSDEFDHADAAKVKIAFNFQPVYPEGAQQHDIELPPDNVSELSEPEVDSERPVV